MFANAAYANAKARYNTIDIDSQVETASPHRLIAILFEELLKTLDALAAGLRAGSGPNRPGMPERRSKSLSILMGLEGCLDHEKGGDLAREMAAVYREARRLIGEGLSRQDATQITQAREMIGEIADAWAQLG